jgi:hypothetical protein
MKKYCLVVVCIVILVQTQAQRRSSSRSSGDLQFSADIGFLLPSSSSLSRATGFGLGFDLIGEKKTSDRVHVGGSIGFGYFFPNSGSRAIYVLPTVMFGARYELGDNFFIGGEIGYGRASQNDYAIGGFAFKPYLMYQAASSVAIKFKFLTFSGDGTNISYFGIGGTFQF